MYSRLLLGPLALEIATELDRAEVAAVADTHLFLKVRTPVKRGLAELMWYRAGREPALHFFATDAQLQHRARYAALYDFLFGAQVGLGE
jgi:hypothetical protein